MKKIMLFVVAFTISMLLIACQPPAPSSQEGQKIADDYINAVNNKNYEQGFTLVADDFWQARSKERWVEYYQAISKEMGPIISVKLSQKLVDERLSGRFYMYQYSIKHENGFTKEMVTMIQKINSSDPLKISGHKIDSSKLLKINQMY